MEGTYALCLGNDEIGKVQVERQGLYYRFTCRCQLHSEVICKVTVSCGGHHENLGVLVPMGDTYGLTKKLPVKNLGTGTPEFWITPKHTGVPGVYVDIYPEEPFRYIARLEKAYLEKRRGRLGIVIPEVEGAVIREEGRTPK